MRVELKIKEKHLASEAKIIRFEEQKYINRFRKSTKDDQKQKLIDTYFSLKQHRQFNVKNEARATHLARAYISGKTYNSVEKKRLDDTYFVTWILPRVHMMVMKYGNRKTTVDDIKKWAGLE